MKDYSELEKKIGYKFKNIKYLIEALTHRSYTNEHKTLFNYERMEFLGDAVLDLITTEYLFEKYTTYDEGTLTKIQSKIVSSQNLSIISEKLNLGDYLKLSKGEEQIGGRKKTSILGDIFETVLAAIYLDGGILEAKKFVLNNLQNIIDKLDSIEDYRDYKTELQEIIQIKYSTLPEYISEREFGPDHNKQFEVSVYVNNIKMGTGVGFSKKSAGKLAAKQALEKIESENK